MDFKGKVALVTGGSRGIGAEICRTLARHGADVAVNYVDDPEGRNCQDAREVASLCIGGGLGIALVVERP